MQWAHRAHHRSSQPRMQQHSSTKHRLYSSTCCLRNPKQGEEHNRTEHSRKHMIKVRELYKGSRGHSILKLRQLDHLALLYTLTPICVCKMEQQSMQKAHLQAQQGTAAGANPTLSAFAQCTHMRRRQSTIRHPPSVDHPTCSSYVGCMHHLHPLHCMANRSSKPLHPNVQFSTTTTATARAASMRVMQGLPTDEHCHAYAQSKLHSSRLKLQLLSVEMQKTTSRTSCEIAARNVHLQHTLRHQTEPRMASRKPPHMTHKMVGQAAAEHRRPRRPQGENCPGC
jgi:hypothetical protein